MKDLKQYRRMTDFLGDTPDLLGTYTTFINDAVLKFFTAHGTPKSEMTKGIIGLLFDRRSFFSVAQDAFKLLRAMRG